MKKINKKSLKQQGGQSVNPQQQQMMQQQQQQQQQQGQQQQQDPTAELAASFSEMVDSGYEPKQVIMQFIEYEVPEELIYQTLLRVGYSEDDVQALFTQVSEEVQQTSNEQRSMMQPQQQMSQAQRGVESEPHPLDDRGQSYDQGNNEGYWPTPKKEPRWSIPINKAPFNSDKDRKTWIQAQKNLRRMEAIEKEILAEENIRRAQYGKEHQYNIKQDEGIVNNYGARVRNWMSQIDPSAGYNRGDTLSKGLKLAQTLGDTFKPKYSFSRGMNPFSKKDKDGDGFADGWFMDSKKKNLLKKNLRQRDKKIRKLQGRSIKIHENDPNKYRFNSMGDFITTQQYDDDVKKYSTAQFVSPTNSYKGYAYDSDPTPYMTPQQKKDYWQHKQEFGTVGDFWKDPVTGKSKKPKKQKKSKWHYMDFMKGYKYGGDLDRYQVLGETPLPLDLKNDLAGTFLPPLDDNFEAWNLDEWQKRKNSYKNKALSIALPIKPEAGMRGFFEGFDIKGSGNIGDRLNLRGGFGSNFNAQDPKIKYNAGITYQANPSISLSADMGGNQKGISNYKFGLKWKHPKKSTKNHVYKYQAGTETPLSPLEPITFKDWYRKNLYRNSGIPPSELNALYEKETGYDANSPAVDVDGTKPWTSPEFMPPKITDPNKSKRTWNQIGNVVGKVGEIGYQAADFVNEAAKAWQDLAKPVHTADDLYDITQNPAGGQGYWDVNSGYLQQPEKTLEGYGWAQRGGSLPRFQALGSVNQNTLNPDIYGQRILGNTPIDYRDPKLAAMLSAMQAQKKGVSRGVTGISNTPKKLPRSFVPASESTSTQGPIILTDQELKNKNWRENVLPTLSAERQQQFNDYEAQKKKDNSTFASRLMEAPGVFLDNTFGTSADPNVVAPTVLPTDPRFYDQVFQGMNMATTIPAYINSYADYISGKREDPQDWRGIFPSGIQEKLGKKDGEQNNIINSLRNDPDFCKKYPLRCAAEEMGLGFWGLPGRLGKKVTGKLAKGSKGAAKDISKEFTEEFVNADEIAEMKAMLKSMNDDPAFKELSEATDLEGMSKAVKNMSQRDVDALEKSMDDWVKKTDADEIIPQELENQQYWIEKAGKSFPNARRSEDYENLGMFDHFEDWLRKKGQVHQAKKSGKKRIKQERKLLEDEGYPKGMTDDQVWHAIERKRLDYLQLGRIRDDVRGNIGKGGRQKWEIDPDHKQWWEKSVVEQEQDVWDEAHKRWRSPYDPQTGKMKVDWQVNSLDRDLLKGSTEDFEELMDYMKNFKKTGGMIRKTQNRNLDKYQGITRSEVGKKKKDPRLYNWSNLEDKQAHYEHWPNVFAQEEERRQSRLLNDPEFRFTEGQDLGIDYRLDNPNERYGDRANANFMAFYNQQGNRMFREKAIPNAEMLREFVQKAGSDAGTPESMARQRAWLNQNYPNLDARNTRFLRQQRGGGLPSYQIEGEIPNQKTMDYLAGKYNQTATDGIYRDFDKIEKPNIKELFRRYNEMYVEKEGMPFTTIGTAPITAKDAALTGNYAQYMRENPNIPVQTIHTQNSTIPPALQRQRGGGDKYRTRNIPPISLIYEHMYKNDPKPSSNWLQHIKDSYPKGGYRGSQDFPPYLTEFYADAEAFKPKRGGFVDEWGEPLPDNWERRWPGRRREDAFWNVHSKNDSMGDAPFDPLKPRKGQEDKWEQLKEKVRFNHRNDETWMDYSDPSITRPKGYKKGGNIDYGNYMPVDMYGHQNAFSTFRRPVYQYGGQPTNIVEVDDRMIQKLIAAGADIEYL